MNAPAVQAGPVNSRRWAIVILLFIAVMINYIDRGNLSIAAVPAMRELGIAPSAMGTLLSAFFWTYALFQTRVHSGQHFSELHPHNAFRPRQGRLRVRLGDVDDGSCEYRVSAPGRLT
jgi:hypothetical protein